MEKRGGTSRSTIRRKRSTAARMGKKQTRSGNLGRENQSVTQLKTTNVKMFPGEGPTQNGRGGKNRINDVWTRQVLHRGRTVPLRKKGKETSTRRSPRTSLLKGSLSQSSAISLKGKEWKTKAWNIRQRLPIRGASWAGRGGGEEKALVPLLS